MAACASDMRACAVTVRLVSLSLVHVQVRRITSTILSLFYRFFSQGMQVHVSLT